MLVFPEHNLSLLRHLVIALSATENSIISVVENEASESFFVPKHFDLSYLILSEFLGFGNWVGTELGADLAIVGCKLYCTHTSTNVPATSGHSELGQLGAIELLKEFFRRPLVSLIGNIRSKHLSESKFRPVSRSSLSRFSILSDFSFSHDALLLEFSKRIGIGRSYILDQTLVNCIESFELVTNQLKFRVQLCELGYVLKL